MTPILETRGLTARFGGVVAVNQVNLKINAGELHCLIGPNGAGKSSLFKMLTGQLKPTSGEVLLNGVSLAGSSPAQIARRGVGIKTQVPNVFDGLTVTQNIRLATDRVLPPQQAQKRAREVEERVGIAHLGKRMVGTLSHGQRQLVELAMVLAPAPDLILLDEPAAGMTGDEVLRLGDLIIELAHSSAVIVVEHDMLFIRRIAGTITVLNQGSVLAEGRADEILSDQRVQDVYLGKETT
jgi:branched-chain amino acid transport system ATP-binding protein